MNKGTVNLSREKLLQLLEEDRKSLATVKRQIVSCTEEYETLRNAGQMESLGAVRQTITTLLAQHGTLNKIFLERRAAHARRCLIPEILVNVFRCLILDVGGSMFLRGGMVHGLSQEELPLDQPPMNISQVCREWRNVALSSPVIWSFLLINPDSLKAFQRASSRSKVWLDRSTASSHPLTFRFSSLVSRMSDLGSQGDQLKTDRINEVSSELLQRLMDHSGRWMRVQISHRLTNTVPINIGSLYNLTDLTCYVTFPRMMLGQQVVEFPPVTIDLSSCRRLQHLSLMGYLNIPSLSNSAALPDLTTLHLEGDLRFMMVASQDFPKGSDCLNIIRSAPRLEDIRISLDGDDSVEVLQEVNPVMLAHLKTLELTYNAALFSTSNSHLLRNIRAPSLELLIFEESSPEPLEDAVQQGAFLELTRFIAQSDLRSSLPTLVLRAMAPHFRLEHLLTVLRQVPGLVHLATFTRSFNVGLFPDMILQMPNSTEFALCPRLETVHFKEDEVPVSTVLGFPESEEGNTHLMLGVISGRWNKPPSERTLRACVIDSPVAHEVRMGEWESVKHLMSEGLRFRISPKSS